MLSGLHALRPATRQAVIINAGTKELTTLALMSALRFLRWPTLVIDCESRDGSVEHFERLRAKYDFELLSAPLRPHGETLDWLFAHTPAETVLLLDSDAEILDEYVARMVERFVDGPDVFGCGFVHGPTGMTTDMGCAPARMGLYQERPWIPFTVMKTAMVREALAAGRSFRDRLIYNDFSPCEPLARLLHRRYRLPALRNSRLSWLNLFKRDYYGHKPSYVYCDTGAEVYQYLKYERGYSFVGLPVTVSGGLVRHYHGVTRRTLNAGDHNATDLNDVLAEIRRLLRETYDVAIPDGDPAPTADMDGRTGTAG